MAHPERMGDKVVLVSGAGSGIGAAISQVLAEHGATVIVTDIDQAAGQEIVKSIGASASFMPLDVMDLAAWEATVAEVLKRHGKIDVLVNNAGGSACAGNIETTSLAAHEKTVDWSLNSAWMGARTVIGPMAEAGGGSIVNISSIDGIIGVNQLSSYVAAKFGVTGLTKALSIEFGDRNVRVNSVHPGITATVPVLSSTGTIAARQEKAIQRQPLKRMGKPRDIAHAVLFFASDESTYCTGTSLVVDGGQIAGPYRDPLEG